MRLRFLLVVLALLLAVMTGMRVSFLLLFQATDTATAAGLTWKAFWVGFRFDLRLALLLVLPVLVLHVFPLLRASRSVRARRFWVGYLTVLATLVALFHLIDLGNYAYLQERLDASALRFLKNPLISGQMVWESYPVVWGALGLAAFAIAVHVVLRRAARRAFEGERPAWSRGRKIAVRVGVVACFLLGLYGKFSFYPLRWSDAYFSSHRFTSDLGLNPVLFFTDSFCTAEEADFDEEKTREYYPEIARLLGVEHPDAARLDFRRTVRPTPLGTKPNVVIVLLESFAAHHTGTFGNPLDPSPNFDAIAKQSLLFRRFYTPRSGTARAVFATVTGIPDTISQQTASRNPRIVGQYTIMSAFEGYKKFYFLGGSAAWANIRGLMSFNVPGMRIYEEGDYPDSPRVDVWGISDLHLFEEANKVFRGLNGEPFLAFIHCSGNHRPYTIPEDNRGFELRDPGEKEVLKYGFNSVAEFNSFRFLDHSVGFFLREAEKEAYAQNTVFLFFGDNGVPGRTLHMPPAEEVLGFNHVHTPFAIYAPGLIHEGRVIDLPASQIDVMATVAGLAGLPALNTTLGRNLLDPRFDQSRYAFVLTKQGTAPGVCLIGDDYCVMAESDGSAARLYDARATDPGVNVAAQHPERTREMARLAMGYYHTSKYMLYHNSPAFHERNGP